MRPKKLSVLAGLASLMHSAAAIAPLGIAQNRNPYDRGSGRTKPVGGKPSQRRRKPRISSRASHHYGRYVKRAARRRARGIA